MAEILLDTDVLIDHLRGKRRLQRPRDGVSYSAITRAELFAGKGADEKGLRTLLAPFRELPVDRAIAELAGRIRRETGVALADALIASTARTHRLTLVTRNRRHFDRVPGLKSRAPA
jgi:predicted nucleic acid-binding protein